MEECAKLWGMKRTYLQHVGQQCAAIRALVKWTEREPCAQLPLSIEARNGRKLVIAERNSSPYTAVSVLNNWGVTAKLTSPRDDIVSQAAIAWGNSLYRTDQPIAQLIGNSKS